MLKRFQLVDLTFETDQIFFLILCIGNKIKEKHVLNEVLGSVVHIHLKA